MPEQKQHNVAKRVAAITALIIFIAIGTLVYHWLEDWTWVQSFYFTVTTLTTVGYGDMHPTSDASRLFTALFILMGVGVVLAALGVIGSSYLDNRTRRIFEEDSKLNHRITMRKKDRAVKKY